MEYRKNSAYARGKRSKNRKRYLVAAGVFVALVLLIFLYLLLFTDVFTPPAEEIALNAGPTATVLSANDSYYYMKGTTLYCANAKGEEIWTLKFTSAGSLNVAVSDTLVCVYDENTANVYDHQKNLLFTVPQSQFRIKNVDVGKNAIAMHTTIAGQEVEYLRVFDSTGTELDRLEIENNRVLQFGLYGEGDSLWYLTLDTSGVTPISQVVTCNPSQKKLTGIKEVYDQLVEGVYFLGTDMYLSGTVSLQSFDTFGEKLRDEITIYGQTLADTATTDDDIYFAYVPRSQAEGGTSYTVRVFSSSGIDTLIQLPKGIKYFAVTPERIYCFSEDTLYVYKNSGEMERQEPLNLTLTGMSRLAEDKVLLRTSTAVYAMEVK